MSNTEAALPWQIYEKTTVHLQAYLSPVHRHSKQWSKNHGIWDTRLCLCYYHQKSVLVRSSSLLVLFSDMITYQYVNWFTVVLASNPETRLFCPHLYFHIFKEEKRGDFYHAICKVLCILTRSGKLIPYSYSKVKFCKLHWALVDRESRVMVF